MLEKQVQVRQLHRENCEALFTKTPSMMEMYKMVFFCFLHVVVSWVLKWRYISFSFEIQLIKDTFLWYVKI